ncbi:MAG: HD domain-containing phosphohydrolase [Candidatus Dehalobacter alkaniphilus]
MEAIYLRDLRHAIRVANMSKRLVDFLSLSEKDKTNFYMSCLFHDVGKSFLSQDILNKPCILTAEERRHIETHSILSFKEVINIGYPEKVAEDILYHHENFDGTGYPYGRKGQSIPLGARIIRITDTFDALTSDRPYRKAMKAETAFAIMEKQKELYDLELYKLFYLLYTKKNF